MANYHLSIKVLSRGKGASAVAKAAYRAAERISCEHTGITSDYTHKRGVIHKEIMLPARAPPEYKDRSVLWNAVEKSEPNKNAQLAREIEVSLPIELTKEQNIALLRGYVKRCFVDKGMCADLCVHDTGKGNPHAHIMLTMRPIDEHGKWAAKSRKEYILDELGEKIVLPSGEFKSRKVNAVDWNDQSKAEQWRAAWGDAVNAALESEGISARVDHRSYKRQGKEQKPTVHMGVAASQMERKGIRTQLGDKNREIAVSNQEMSRLRARIRHIENWVYAQPLQNPPTLSDMLFCRNQEQQMKSRWQKIAHLQRTAEALIFVQRNGIRDIPSLAEAVTKIHERQYDLAADIKAKERRISTLKLHLEQVETRKQNAAVYRKYRQLEPKRRAVYAEKHTDEIERYEAADKYLKDHLSGYGKIPENAWKAELKELLTGRFMQVEQYYKLKEDVKNVETIRRGADNLMRGITPEQTTARTREVTL